jgi:hypothetical protein
MKRLMGEYAEPSMLREEREDVTNLTGSAPRAPWVHRRDDCCCRCHVGVNVDVLARCGCFVQQVPDA